MLYLYTIDDYYYLQDTSTVSKQLSRSSSIRSIPSTPAIPKQHPLPSLQHGKSPSVSPGRSPAHRCASAESNANKTSKDGGDKKKEKRTRSWTPTTTSVNKLYTFTTMNDSFGTSPISGKYFEHLKESAVTKQLNPFWTLFRAYTISWRSWLFLYLYNTKKDGIQTATYFQVELHQLSRSFYKQNFKKCILDMTSLVRDIKVEEKWDWGWVFE